MTHYLYKASFVVLLVLSNLIAAAPDTKPSTSARKKFSQPISLNELAQSSYYTKILNASQAIHDIKTIEYPEQFVINLPNATVLSDRGMVITANNRPFFDYVSEIADTIPNWKISFIEGALTLEYADKIELFNGSLVNLSSSAEGCYYHWMLESLPRFKTIARSKLPYNKVFVGGTRRAYKKETLKKLGIPEATIMYGQQTSAIKCNNVIIPSMPHLLQFTRPTWACDFVRSLFLDKKSAIPPLPQKKIYISRKNGGMKKSLRIIINENEVFQHLQKKGFEKAVLEDLSVEEQAQLFNTAKIIVAAHGASLTNLVFCNAHAPVTLIEIYQPQWINRCYTSLTQQLNHDRGFQFNHIQLRTSTENLSQKDRAAGNIYVGLGQLDNALSLPKQSLSPRYDNHLLEHHHPLLPLIPHLDDFTGTLAACDLIRSTFLGNAPQKPAIHGKKLYIARERHSRHEESQRIIMNEQDLINHLESKGFLIVALDELTLHEQAQLFNAAEVIVAAEGAPLINLIFCNPEKKVNVIEIYNPGLVNEYYATLAHKLNNERNFQFNHSYCIASPDNLSEEDCDAHKIQVELNQLDKILKECAHEKNNPSQGE